MKPFNFRQTIWKVIARKVYFPFFMGFFCSELYEVFTGKSLFNVWHDRLLGIVSVCVGIHAVFSSRKNGFSSFLLDTLGGLGLIGTGVYLILN